MSTTYTINVTQEDIERGIRKNCFSCPVALASQRIFGKQNASVHSYDIVVISPNMFQHRITLPDLVSTFIADFDTKHPVKPFTFEITL